jgi:hypothetical protein
LTQIQLKAIKGNNGEDWVAQLRLMFSWGKKLAFVRNGTLRPRKYKMSWMGQPLVWFRGDSVANYGVIPIESILRREFVVPRIIEKGMDG